MGSYVVLKKNSILMNSFSIEPVYPYVNQNFIDLAKTLKKFNGLNKTFHKAIAKIHLDPQIYSLLKKIGGTSGTNSLFKDDDSYQNLHQIIKTKPIYKYFNNKYLDKEIHFNYQQAERDLVLKLLYLYLFERLFLSNEDNDYQKQYIDFKLDNIL